MTSIAELNDIALTLLQVTGLLLPVVFLTANFVKNEGVFNEISDERQNKLSKLFIYMVLSLSVTGLLATLGILRWSIKESLLFISVLFLASFFLMYGVFIYWITK